MPHVPGFPGNITVITGPMLLGNLFSYGLFGILVVQVFMYRYQFPQDPVGIKTLVYVVFLADVLTIILSTYSVWQKLGPGWGDLPTLLVLNWPMGSLSVLSGFIASAVHFFFAWRIWKLQKSLIIPTIIPIISLTQWGMATYVGIHGITLGIARLNELNPHVTVWLGGSAVCDVLITVTMVSILFRAGNKSAFLTTHSMVARLITLTVETGMTTSFAAIIELILFLVLPGNNMHFIPFLILSKLYSNTLLATLNARVLFRDPHSTLSIQPALWSDDGKSGQSTTRVAMAAMKSNNGVQVSTTTESRHDLEMVVLANESNDGIFPEKKRSS